MSTNSIPVTQDQTEDRTSQVLAQMTGKSDAKLIADLDSKFATCRANRLQFERQWYTNMAFYFGKQWVQWLSAGNATTARLYTPNAPPWRVRLISNKIKPIIRTEIAKLTQEKPQPFVVPASSDDQDLMAARAGEQIFEHHARELKFNREMRRTIFWTVLCGSGFIKDWFDPTKYDGDIKGSVNIERVSPFHIYVPEVQEEDMENQPFLIHSISKPKEWVKDNFGDESKGLEATSAGSGDQVQQKYQSALGLTHSAKNLVTVNEIWVKPTKEYPQGAVITWAGDKILRKIDSWPYEHGEFPFSKIDHIPSGKFYADSVINDLIPLQKEYNRTRSQIIEAKNRMSKPQLLAARGSVDPNKITSEPGLIVFYTPGFQPPSPIPLQNLPSYVLEETERTQRDMDDIAAQHEVTKGRTPPGVEAATAISYLQEQDDSKLSTTVSSIEEATERIGRHMLSHVRQFWSLPRLVKVVGDEGVYESLELKSDSLKGNTDLRVEAGSAAPRSRAAKQAFFMELGKMGWIPPDRALRYLEMAETGRLYEELHIDSRQAQRENVRISKGEEVPPNSWDNHEVHIMEHNNFRKKQKYELLPPEVQVMFEKHVQMHKQVLMQEQGKMAPPGAPLPAGMGQEGGEPPPEGGGQQGGSSGVMRGQEPAPEQ